MKPVLPLLMLLALASSAATVPDREGAVRGDRAKLAKDSRWHYNDFARGLEEAKWTSKPVLVVLRCVPCTACAGIDTAVLLENSELAPLLDQFVCVRIINANSLDLHTFQFDYDLSFSMLFFSPEGVVYGRYGSWKHQKDPQDTSSLGLKRTLEAVLQLHSHYPANRTALAGKQGDALPFKTPVEIPLLGQRYKPELDWEGKVVQSCVHCHQIGEALREDIRSRNQTLPARLIYPWPPPETIGLTFSPDEVTRISEVLPESPAAKAGLKAGDDLLSLSGQPLISSADVSWVLHRSPDRGSLRATVKTPTGEKTISLSLPRGWRAKEDISRRVGTWGMRGMAMGGLVVEDLADARRSERAIDSKKMALLVKFVGTSGKREVAKKAGFMKDDIITELDKRTNRMTESEVLGYLLQKYEPGKKIEAVVLRGDQRVSLTMPIQ